MRRSEVLSRSRTEPASRVERAQMLLAYRENPSFFAVGQRLGVHHQTVQRCVERAVAYGPLAALDDRPRPGAGHECLATLVQGTVCKFLGQEEIKPHKVRYYLERRDAEFEQKMAEVLCVYREVQVLKKAGAKSRKAIKRGAIVSYDEKPGIQALAMTAPDLPPEPAVHATFARDHEYKRHGTLNLVAGIDLLTGKGHTLVRDRHRLPDV